MNTLEKKTEGVTKYVISLITEKSHVLRAFFLIILLQKLTYFARANRK